MPASFTQGLPGRFVLRELFFLTALVALSAASYTWIHSRPDSTLLFLIAVVSTLSYALHILTRWSTSSLLVFAALLFLAGFCLLPAVQNPRTPSARLQCRNHLKMFVLALQNYHDVYGSFPPAYVADAQGKPMHSWRVLLLPYLEHGELHKKYRFDEPWNGPNNSKLHATRVRIFQCPLNKKPTNNTNYLAIVGPNTIWPGSQATKLADITDGASNTIILAEVANSGIHWMDPRDLDASQMAMTINPKQGPGISSPHPRTANVAFADGHVDSLPDDTPPTTLRAALTRNGGDSVTLP